MYNNKLLSTSSGFQSSYQVGAPGEANGTSAYRKFQHRRIYTEIDEGSSPYVNTTSQQSRYAYGGATNKQNYRKEDSKSKAVEPQNVQPTHSRLGAQGGNSKGYKMVAKPNPYLKYIKT